MSSLPTPDVEAPEHWVLAAARAADDKLATDTVIIEVGDVLGITGHFLITTGRNSRQVRAIGEEIEDQLKMLDGPEPIRTEGRGEYQWLLMDYGDFVVHIFEAQARSYYSLDRLWSDQPRVPFAPQQPTAAATAD